MPTNAINIKDAVKSRILADEEVSDTQIYRWMSEAKLIAETMEPTLGGGGIGPGRPALHTIKNVNVLAGSCDHTPGSPDAAGHTTMFLPPQILDVRKMTLRLGKYVPGGAISKVFGSSADNGAPPAWFWPATTVVGTTGLTVDSVGRDLVPYLTSTNSHHEADLEARGTDYVDDSDLGSIEYLPLGDFDTVRYGNRHPSTLNTFGLEYRQSSEIKFYEGDADYRFEQDPWGGILVNAFGAGLITSVQQNYHIFTLEVVMRTPDYGERDYSTIGGRPFGSATGSWNEDIFTKGCPDLLYYGALWKAFEFLDDDDSRSDKYRRKFLELVSAWRKSQRGLLYQKTPSGRRHRFNRGGFVPPAADTVGS